jgi:hypothetical protein
MRVFCAPDASTGPALLGYSSPLAAGWPTLCAVRRGWVRSSSPFHFFSVIPSGAARFFFRAALWRVGLRSRGTVATRKVLAHSLRPQAVRVAALVVRKVPAQICDNCGEAYVSAEVTRTLLQSAREALRAGVEVDIREFVANPV